MCLSIYLSIYLSTYLPKSIYLPVYLQAWKRNYSARRPQVFNVTTSKTEQFYETSSMFELDTVKYETILRDFFFELDNVQNEAILRDLFMFWICEHQKWSNSARRPSKMESWVQSWRPRANSFCDFYSPSNMPLVLRLPRNVLRATTACTFSTSQLPKVVQAWCVLYIFTSKCTSCHNGVHFFDISTSKSGPRMVCFVHFALEMCSAPQRRAFFSSLIWLDGPAPAALASLLFDPPEPQIIGKTQCFPTFLPFAHLHLLSSDSLSSLILSLLPFSSLWLFLSLLFICPYCQKFDF